MSQVVALDDTQELPAVNATPRKWTIYYPEKKQYQTRGKGSGIAWTTDLTKAKKTAHDFGGVVVDAEWFSKNWNILANDGEIPDEAKPPV